MDKVYVSRDATDTSREAAKRATRTVTGDAATVLAFICERAELGSTADEVIVGTGLAYNTTTARIRGLKDAKLVRAVDGWTRPTRTGAQAQVLVPTENGMAAWRGVA